MIIFEQVSQRVKLNSGKVKSILSKVSFTWNVGENIGIIGLNGSGKTTLLRLIGNFEKPTEGKIIRKPKNIQISNVFQRPEDHFIYETVISQISNHARRRLSINSILEIVDRVGLSRDLLLQSPHSLSTGQQRLVAIASALTKQADFYLLDEPMAGLDAQNRKLVSTALKNLGENYQIGLMLVSHHPDDLIGLVDRIMILNNQELLYDGDIEKVHLEALYACIANEDPSLFLLIRRLIESTPRIDHRLLTLSSHDEIAKFIDVGLKK